MHRRNQPFGKINETQNPLGPVHEATACQNGRRKFGTHERFLDGTTQRKP
jgi:hypothetical protein